MSKLRTQEIKLDPEYVEFLDLQLFDVVNAWSRSEDKYDLRALARNCYLQGLLDASSPAVVEALAVLRAIESQPSPEGEQKA